MSFEKDNRLEYHCKINDRIIFDCAQLLLPNEKEKVLSDPDLTPIQDKKNDDNLVLCKVKFNVISCIFPSVNPFEVIQGWKHLSQYLRLDQALQLDRMSELFIVEYLRKLNSCPQSMFCNAEPDIIDCARLTYWYYICLKNDNNNTFQHKKKEIKGKLRRGLVTNPEQFKSSYSYENNEAFERVDKISDGERVKKVVEILPRVKTALPLNTETTKQYNNYMYQWFKEVFSINAELMFAGLCSLKGHRVSFVPGDESHDYDFLINHIPVQVKANVIYRGNSYRVRKYLEEIQGIIEMSYDRTLTLQHVENKIINFIRTDYLEQIRRAIEQKAKIVFIDGTQSSIGFLSKYHQDEDRLLIIKCIDLMVSKARREQGYISIDD